MFPLLFLTQRRSSCRVALPVLNTSEHFFTSHFLEIEKHTYKSRQIKIPIFKNLLFNGDTGDGEQKNKSMFSTLTDIKY